MYKKGNPVRIVITGGTGLIGRALATALQREGAEPIVLSRTPERVRDLPVGVTVAGWKGRSAKTLTPLIDGSAAVVHLAGESIGEGRWTKTRKDRIRESRVESSSAVARAVEACSSPPGVLLQGSAIGFYGGVGDEQVDEGADPGTGYLAGVTTAWEAASESVGAVGVRRVILRTGVVLSRGGGALPRMLLPFRMFIGGPVGNGRQWISWIHLEDTVRALQFLLATPTAQGPFNLTAPEPVMNRDFARTLGRVLNRPSAISTPPFALRLVLGEQSSLVLEGRRVLPTKLLGEGFSFRYGSLEPALRDLLNSEV